MGRVEKKEDLFLGGGFSGIWTGGLTRHSGLFWNFYGIYSKFINIELHMYTSVSKSFPKRMMPP
jgi:hypothetical protein